MAWENKCVCSRMKAADFRMRNKKALYGGDLKESIYLCIIQLYIQYKTMKIYHVFINYSFFTSSWKWAECFDSESDFIFMRAVNQWPS